MLIPRSAHASTATDCFRSRVSGNWSVATNWQSAPFTAGACGTYGTANLAPTSSANRIQIQNTHNITINAAATAKDLTIDAGGTLTQSAGISFTLSPQVTNAQTFIVNGTYVMNNAHATVNAGATVQINNGGVVRVNTSDGTSDAIATAASSTFATGAIFEWNTAAAAFNTNGVTYFQNAAAGTTPIFRVTAAPASVGAAGNLVVKGKLEVNTALSFANAGTKTIRDGITGTGTLTHSTTSGALALNGTTATIDGTVTIAIDNSAVGTSDFEITSGTTTISSGPTVKIGSATASDADFVIKGTLKQNDSTPIDVTKGNITVQGKIDATSTGTLTPSATTNISVTGTSGGNAGSLKLTSGATTINNFTMNRTGTGAQFDLASPLTVNGTLTLTSGIVTTGQNLMIAKAGQITYPASYNTSFVATTDSSGNALTGTGLGVTATTPFDGAIGFRITNLPTSGFTMFPVSSDFTSANRMEVDMNGTSGNTITVVVGKGDIGNTPDPRVNRVWYTNSSITSGFNAKVRLYYTKQDWNNWGTTEDEVEAGFVYATGQLVEKNYSGGNYFTDVSSGSDVVDFTNITTYPYGSEVYAQFTTTGIDDFYKYSVVNADNIILCLDCGDNQLNLDFRIVAGGAIPSVADIGTATAMSAMVKNVGSDDYGPIKVSLYKAINADGDGEEEIGYVTTPYSGFGTGGATWLANYTYTFPTTDGGTTRYLRACADTLNNITETNEANNCSNWQSIYVNIPPVANAGVDKTITLPTSSVSVTGTATDSDGTITGTQWIFVGGPTGVTPTIVSPSSLTTNITGMTTAGVYTFRLRVQDNTGSFDTDTMKVTVN